jgi:hypothetical protein
MNLTLKEYVPDPLKWRRYFEKRHAVQTGGGGAMLTMDEMDGKVPPRSSKAEQTVRQAKSQLALEAKAASAIRQPKRRRTYEADILQISKTVVTPAEQTVRQAKSQLALEAKATSAIRQPKRRRTSVAKTHQSGGTRATHRRVHKTTRKIKFGF